MKAVILLATSAVTAAVLTASSVAQAVDDFGPMATPQVIPYHGYVEINGQAYNGDLTMRFTLSIDEEVDRDSGFLWQDDAVAVQVYRGEFSTPLGAGAIPLPPGVFDQNFVYLAIDIDPAGDGSWLPLSNAQRLIPVPFAYMSAHARDIHASGEIVWGDNDSYLRNDQGGAIELGGSRERVGTGTPYIDFHYLDDTDGPPDDLPVDYSIRLLNDGPDLLVLRGGDLFIDTGDLQIGDMTFANDTAHQLALTGGLLEIGELVLRPIGGGSGNSHLFAGNGVGAFHIDAENTLYLNWYSGDAVIFGDGAAGNAAMASISSDGDMTLAGDLSVDGDITNLRWIPGETVSCTDGTCDPEAVLGDATNVFDQVCFLTRMVVDDVDGSGENAECRIEVRGGEGWTLEALVDTSTDADVTCHAHCLTWRAP